MDSTASSLGEIGGGCWVGLVPDFIAISMELISCLFTQLEEHVKRLREELEREREERNYFQLERDKVDL